MAMYNFWATRRKAERIFTLVARTLPIILAAITIGLLQTAAVQSSFTAYMVVANFQCEPHILSWSGSLRVGVC